jgi:hypothetical protein
MVAFCDTLASTEPCLRRRSFVIALLSTAWAAAGAHAQTARLGASAIGLATRVDPIVLGESRTGAYVTQPVVMLNAGMLDGALTLVGMLNVEALTIPAGELSAGMWGEGFIDKRHPHTYLHELVGSARAARGGVTASLSIGRGFAPFGTDDPMSRPFVRFPTNHHLSQIPERLIGVAAIAAGPVVIEAGLFNGDEPDNPRDIGEVDRFADSWATRVTLRPIAGLELQGSHAAVESPEVSFGGGADQRKWSGSVRWEAGIGDVQTYALAEWARTTEYDNDEALFGFRSWLLEAAATHERLSAAVRYEDATRPEEERTGSPFRSPRPHTDFHLLGITRWRTASAHLEYRVDAGALRFVPFTEIGFSRVDDTVGGLIQPESFFGDDVITTLSAGARVGIGHTHERMGRYGAALPAPSMHAGH